ncbi:MAG: hypothetical protein B6245_15550 [Desulfobacteraceae bacterium 4572_88]|nr:MAG: hypothetical protein B6245_15550 [Desulfobacteraceae bacterium 4572_88]RLC08173.1 MAG: hypothetical protein DRI57_24505 [Deltaproteobacteria bacterium]
MKRSIGLVRSAKIKRSGFLRVRDLSRRPLLPEPPVTALASAKSSLSSFSHSSFPEQLLTALAFAKNRFA